METEKMTRRINGKQASSYLEQLCDDIDAGRKPQRFGIRATVAKVALPALLGLSSIGLAGCVGEIQTTTLPDVIVITNPTPVEICNDGVDNDRDGAIDCADSQCNQTSFCIEPVALYAAVMPPQREICGDGQDNDRDGRTDCADDDCRFIAACAMPVPAYAVPSPDFGPEMCGDGIDNDRDGAIDCGDSDCDAYMGCAPVAEYGIPFEPREICTDRIDNDGDGAIDCADSDCGCAIALYAVPPMDREPTPRPDRPPTLYGVPFMR